MGNIESLISRGNFFSLKFKNNAKGILWKFLSCLAFALVNAIVRHLSGSVADGGTALPAYVIVFFQNLFGLLFFCPFLFKNGSLALKTKWPFLHAIRVLAAVLGIICLYYAFAHIPIAQAVALQFTGPVFAVIGARLYLKEKLSLYRIWGVILGLVGAFILTRPDKAIMSGENIRSYFMLFPLLSALFFAVVKILNRKLTLNGEPAGMLTAHLIFFMVPVSFIIALPSWVSPSLYSLPYLCLLGAMSGFANYAMARAFYYADITFLTPFGFARIFFTYILGFILFSEIPSNEYLWLGCVAIMFGTTLITLAERDKMEIKA